MTSITYSNSAYYDSNNQRHILTTGSSNFGSMTINSQVPEAFVVNLKAFAFSNPYISTSFGDSTNRYTTLITGSNVGIAYNSSNLVQSTYTFPTGASNEVSLKYSLSNISLHINRTQVLSTSHSNCSFADNSYFQISASNSGINASNSAYIQYPVVTPVISVSTPTEFHGSVKVNGSIINSNLTIISNQATYSSNNFSNYFLNTTGTTLSNYAYSNLNNRITTANDTANWSSNNITSINYSSNALSNYLPLTGGTIQSLTTSPFIVRYENQSLNSSAVNPVMEVVSYSRSNVQNGFGGSIAFRSSRTGAHLTDTGYIQCYIYSGANSPADRYAMNFRIRDDDTVRTPLTILGEGRVGINTTSPTQALDVSGNITASGTVSGTNITALSNAAYWSSNNINAITYGSNSSAYSSNALSNYLPLTGGSMTGTIAFKNGTDSLVSPSNNQMTFISSFSGDYYRQCLRTRHSSGTAYNSFDFFVWQEGQNVSADGNKLAMAVTDKGVGIQKINPSQALDVTGNILASGTIQGSNFVGSTITSLSNLGMFSSNLSVWTSNNIIRNIGASGYASSLLTSGNPIDTYTLNQLEFGFNGTNTYRHAIKTRHNAGANTNNAIDFALWNTTLSNNVIGSTAMSITPLGVGIGYGNRNPKYALQVDGKVMLTHTASVDDRNALILSEWTSTDSPQKNYSLGIYNGELTYQLPALNDGGGNVLSAHTFYSGDSVGYNELMRINWNKTVSIGNAGGKLYGLGVAAPSNTSPLIATFVDKDATTVVNITGYNTSQFNPNGAACIMFVGRNTTTGRSINAGGQINAAGLDYAEYMTKKDHKVVFEKGDIVGIDANGLLTDEYDEAVHYLIKSSDPSFVGGDRWSDMLTERGKVEKGKEKEWEDELESKRQLVDRISYSGQTPVNITDFNIGDYIIPEKKGKKIGMTAVSENAITFLQYKNAIGKVIKRLPDGRAWCIVKCI